MRIRSGFRIGASRGFLEGSILALILFGLGCEKSPQAASQSEGKQPSSASVPAPPPDRGKDESAVDEATEATPASPESAVDPAVRAVHFDDSTSPEFQKGFRELDEWVKKNGGQVHAALVDLATDKWLVKAGANVPVNPASNAKVLTAAAALELLGPAFTFATRLHGDVDAQGVAKRLVLVGGGAPDLTTADLYRLVRVALGEGLSQVEEIIVDQSRFTDDFVPPAFEQQPKEWAPFRAPISALALNENTISLNVVPTEQGKRARVWYDPPGIVTARGTVTTSKPESGDRVTWTLDVEQTPRVPVSTVGGSLAEGLGRRRYERRMEDPRLAGGLALAELLTEAGVKGDKKVSLGKLKKEKRIALWYSEPLAEVVRALGKDSDNFVAEMLLVALSSAEKDAKEEAAWSSKRGAQVVREWLASKKIELENLRIENGSGLFDANRLTVEVLTKVLAAVEDNPRIYQDFVSHLAMGRTDGTMKTRMRGDDLGARIRAKTGTLNGVDALSGYVLRPGGRSPAAFSVIVVGARGSHSAVRDRVDRMVLSWARLLEEGSR